MLCDDRRPAHCPVLLLVYVRGIVLRFVIFPLRVSLLDCFADTVRLNGNVQSTDSTIANQDAPLFLTWRGFIIIGRYLLPFPCTFVIVLRPATVKARLPP